MKTLLKLVGIIALTAVIGFVISCGGGGGGGGGGGDGGSRTFKSITVTAPPAKIHYLKGESLDLDGLVVTASYSDGSTAALSKSDYTTSGFETNTLGDKPITVSYKEKTAVFTVHVGIFPMVNIPAGSFWMGSPAAEPNREASGRDETQHQVTLTGDFKIGVQELTQGQWQTVMGYDDRLYAVNMGTNYGRGSDYPMYYISWYDIIVFCNKLSEMEELTPAYSINGSTNPDDWGTVPTASDAAWDAVEIAAGSTGYRLPTEAQWEYACRGDYPNKAAEKDTKPFNIGEGDKMMPGMANFVTRYTYILPAGDTDEGLGSEAELAQEKKTTPVGQYGAANANSYGLDDMHGNIIEWCWDWLGDYSVGEDPQGPETGTGRILRGGGWNTEAQYVRSAYRYANDPFHSERNRGVRLSRP